MDTGKAPRNAMIWPLFRRRDPRRDTISALYGMIVAQARLPAFYRDYGVPDTVNGRLDLIVLHLALFWGRAGQKTEQEAELRGLGQEVFDLFCQDMDDNLREIGISDMKVPKQMRQLGEQFYGQAQAYQGALAAPGGEALAEVLARNVYAGVEAGAVARLAAYMRRAVEELAAQPAAQIMRGELHFPDPAFVTQTA